MPESTHQLPAMVDAHGEVVRLITAEHLLQAAGLQHLPDADYDALGAFADNADHLAAIAREAKGMVGEEAIRRMDRLGRWTLHEAGFDFSAPSPQAGTTRYDTDLLGEALRRLLVNDLIDQEAADAALEPQHGTVEITAAQLDLLDQAISIERLELRTEARQILDRLRGEIPATTYKQRPAGIARLLKLGGDVAREIQECQLEVDPPARTAKIKRQAPAR